MTDQFTPRTVIVVALASLVAGFVTVFGGGMLALRTRARNEPPVEAPSAPEPAAPEGPAEPTAPESATASEAAGDAAVESPGSDDASAPATAAGGVVISPLAISRCFDGMAPTPLPAERCGRLPELDAHFAGRAAQIAGCANGAHGRLAFVMDFRFSNQHVSAWGGPASTLPNAGPVSLCVRRVTAPLPLVTMPHAHDRYVATYVIEWP